MSRTTLCALTAGALAVLSLGAMGLRYAVLGDEVRRPVGPNTWRVTLAVQGSGPANAKLTTVTPLELDGQHLLDDRYASKQLTPKAPDARHPLRRRVAWARRAAAGGPFKARCDFHVALQPRVGASGPPATGPYAPPRPGEWLGEQRLIEVHHERVSGLARELTAGLGEGNPLDVAQALFRHVAGRVETEPRVDGPPTSAVACLEAGAGDRAAKSRLLVALLRNRGVPARVVTGLALAKAPEQPGHYWVEAYVHDAWTPMCPTHRHFGRVPSTYLVFGLGDRPFVTARRVSDLKYAFLVKRVGLEGAPADDSAWRRAARSLSLSALPPGDRRLVEVLLLLPPAALVICVFRNVIGLNSFGTFAPALIGLAFHDLHSLPGILVFVSILLVGWLMRRWLDRYHLLQVPRVATMLTLIMGLLIALIVAGNLYGGAAATRYVSLFPMVILTGMVERFWTLETEDSTAASFRTLLSTMFLATVIALVLSRPWLVRQLFCYPETLGLVMAAQLLIGRYTGYRLMELFRFREFLHLRGAS